MKVEELTNKKKNFLFKKVVEQDVHNKKKSVINLNSKK